MSARPALPAREELAGVLELVAREAALYLARVDDEPLRRPRAADAPLPRPRADDVARSFRRPLPEEGEGASAALRELVERGAEALVASSGPRCFHLVVGGVTPAALGADWLASTFDQIAYAWVTSPLAVELERLSIEWLKELFGLPARFGGVFTSGATMANFVGLACARQWWGERQGVDPSEAGLAGLPAAPVLTSGYIHASAVKTLALLGIGRRQVRRLAKDAVGRLDLEALERALAELDGRPAILVANAGEVNAGDFDPIERMADLAERHGAWLHVDGAFGLFARVSPQSADLAAGVERADSITVDGHKWLNVPYDCGFSLVRDRALMARTFAYDAAYLPDPDDDRPVLGSIGPESSRRARSLSVWATLRAYGRRGVVAVVEHHLELARRLADHVRAAPDLELLAEPRLNIVSFRYAPAGRPAAELDRLNRTLGEALLADGRFYVGTTLTGGRVALRPAFANWRIRPTDVDAFVEVVRELGARLAAGS